MIIGFMSGINTRFHLCNPTPNTWQQSRPSLGHLIITACWFLAEELLIAAFVFGTHSPVNQCNALILALKFVSINFI
jgi:hypothetical protein